MPPRSQISQNIRYSWNSKRVYAPNRFNLVINRDLRRAALFLWIMPFPATRSSMLIASPTAVDAVVESPARIASSAFFTNVRADVRNGRLRRRRRSATRIRFFAESLFAKVVHLLSRFQQFGFSVNRPASGGAKATRLATTKQSYQILSSESTFVTYGSLEPLLSSCIDNARHDLFPMVRHIDGNAFRERRS